MVVLLTVRQGWFRGAGIAVDQVPSCVGTAWQGKAVEKRLPWVYELLLMPSDLLG